ncbi:MAG: endolytic transglycosylase MltG [Acidobacteria bacterium]|nr:MAG: endolytic transglycosylase MltG [Acidobacteriota bacterium]
MRRRLLRAAALLAVAGITAAGWSWWAIHQPYRGYDGELGFEVRPGQAARAVLEELAAAGVLADARLARLYLVYVLGDPPIKAGEYRFDAPLSTPEVLAKLIRGAVVAYPLTLIEGLTLSEVAAAIEAAGFSDAGALRREMEDPSRIADLDPAATDLEGYLFPDTYHFARGTSARTIVDTLVATFRRRYAEQVAPLLAADRDPALGGGVRAVVTLASIVEKEALLDDERPAIAGVFANRLRRGMRLDADPTVIYAIKQRGDWDGNLRRADLRYDSPYNTYVYAGLPPGPICSPGLASLRAAAAPAAVPYFYFVSRNDGSHVFARTLSEHNRNVEHWQRRYWRERWARERDGG